ncbi:hypothetical protein Dimus_012408 [Dionaea muscipula]
MGSLVHYDDGTHSLSPTDFICNFKRKTPLQLQTLENLYSEDRYPTQRRLEDYACAMGLTYEQVRGWFIERRRKGKKDIGGIGGRSGSAKICKIKKNKNKKQNQLNLVRRNGGLEGPVIMQDMLHSPGYILKNVFRKDGPSFGVEFDAVPSPSGRHHPDNESSPDASQDDQAGSIAEGYGLTTLDCQPQNETCAPVRKHGMGKGLMTLWRATNPDAAHSTASKRRKVLSDTSSFPANKHGIGKGLMTVWKVMHPNTGKFHALGLSSDIGAAGASNLTSSHHQNPLRHKKTRKKPVSRKSGNKIQPKKKPPARKRKLDCNNNKNQKASREKCGLSIDVARCKQHLTPFVTLVDDEELELREQQSGPDAPTCSAHFVTNEKHGCPFCKDLLAKFPPNFIRKKQPFPLQPWSSSADLVKKLFKVFHFLYTYAVITEICSFTLDEFAQAFTDKDSLLLGKIHVGLLELLLSDIEKELSSGPFPWTTKNCMFRNLLQSVEDQKFDLSFWKKSMNSVTWIEILRQVLNAAGYGSKGGTLIKEGLEKEVSPMAKYGLRPGTLKAALFSILVDQGNKGTRVSDLVKSSQIVDLGLADTTVELEELICSTLASDITLFEKISTSAYRLRLNSLANRDEDCSSDSEDSGSIDESFRDGGACNDGHFLCNSGMSDSSGTDVNRHCDKNSISSPCTEIDESLPGEAWLLGLMEGEYSDLTIEEKLKVLAALIDILSAGSSITMEEPIAPALEGVPKVYQHGSGAKIKRSSVSDCNLHWSSHSSVWQVVGNEEGCSQVEAPPVDSSALMLLLGGKDKSSCRSRDAKETEVGDHLHPMQSIFLGSDRRYNRYWLFLGPCVANDPGHKRVYFESSEDGHWEVIDTEEDLCALLEVLDNRGRREAALMVSLIERSTFLFEEMARSLAADANFSLSTRSDLSELDGVNENRSSPVSDVDNSMCSAVVSRNTIASSCAEVLEVGKKVEEQKQKWNRLQALDSWIWSSFCSNLHAFKKTKRSYLDSLTRCGTCHDLYWRDEKHCRICHTTFELDFELEEKYAIHAATCREKEDHIYPSHKIFPSRLQALKAAIHAVESAMPETVLIGSWTKSAHKLWVKRLRRTSSLPELIQVLSDFVSAMNVGSQSRSNSAFEEIVAGFSNLPQTTSAVGLWVVKLDSLIASYSG